MTRVILILALMFVLAWAFWRFVDGIIDAFGGTTKQRKQRAAPMKLVRDPVCGTWIARKDELALRVGTVTHYFCSESCRAKFQSR